MSGKSLLQLRPGEKFSDLYVAISDVSVAPQRNGAHYATLRIRDLSGLRGAKIFGVAADFKENLNGVEYAFITGFVDNSARYSGELKIDQLEPAKAPENPEEFAAPLPRNYKAHRARFKEVMASVRNPHLHALLGSVFDGEFWETFCQAPAATRNHHAYRGGLLEHCGEVALLCDRVTQVLPHLDRDVLVSAALLHDIGKIEEMSFDAASGEANYTCAGHLVGHVVLGACAVSRAADALENFPCELKHALMHLILSHHGEPEWGAAKRPMCVEAVILNQCDLMSARAASCRGVLESGAQGDFLPHRNFHSTISGGHNSVYVGLMRPLMPVDEE